MAAPRKVLYIMGRGTLGGVERHVQALIRNLDRTMFVPHVAILMDGGSVEDELRASGVPVFVLGGNSGWDPKLAWRLHRVIREARTDLVHSHELHGAVGAALRASPSRCWIHTEHCSFERGPSPRRAALLWKLFGGRMNRIICVSQATADGLCRNTGIKPGRIATVFNGVDIETLPPKNPNYLRDELHVEASAPILGLVGRLAWQKGIDDFLEFATRAAKKITAARFVIAGDGPERDALQSKAAALNLAGRCFFLGNRPDGAAIIGGLDMFL
ncbi:glycosyltransferase, partial [Candidatus Sumerlaeota bacterium]|nr:glycosyltransferase [Candidatus Sumerlaeota bacterium]